MKLKKLLKDISIKAIKGSKDIEVTGICSNSKLVAPGNLFIARKGRSSDGNRYIPEAIAAGAVAVATDIYDPSFKNVVQVIHPDVTSIEGLIAAQYYQFPSDELFTVGITGTNGKTTTTYLVKHLLEKLGKPCGLIGTIEHIIGIHHYNATHTTPDVTTNHKLMREMKLQGCQAATMEVTSHALDQGRVNGINFDVAIFTNLTLDHLDYHLTMEDYCLAKNKLFRSLKPSTRKKNAPSAIANADSLWFQKIVEGCQVKILTYAIENPAEIRASDIRLFASGTEFNLTYKGKIYPCFSPLVGRYNVYNCLAALAVGLILGEPIEKLVELMKNFPTVKGRLELVPNSLGLKIYVDFAHSDDALINVLECLKEVSTGRIITVFGCGGDRDQSKRPKMAQAAEQYSSLCIVTSDNPRSENPTTICKQIIQGFKDPNSYIVELDRRAAIEKAIDIANPEDIILIAGKGHETYQIFAHKTVEFDDRKVAIQLCDLKPVPQK